MNILMLTYEVMDEGGNFIRCFSLAKNLVKLGHKVTLLASNRKPGFFEKKTVRQGVMIIEVACPLPHRIRHNGTSPFQVFGRILYIIKHHHYDLVHGFGHRPSVGIPALFFKFYRRRPYVADWADLWGWGGLASYRGGVFGNVTGLLDDLAERSVYRLADFVTVISRALQKRAIRNGVNPNNIHLLPVGSNVDSISPLSKQKMRRLQRLPLDCPIVVFVGNAKYDADLLARSFVELLKVNPRSLLLFIGAQMPVFDLTVKQFQANERVIYRGFIRNDELGELLACGDAMLLPYTDREINRGRFPNKIGDYMAAGRPTVSNPTGDLKNLFTNDKIGVLAPEKPRDMARVIQNLLKNKKLLKEYGANARKAAVKKYSWLLLAKNLEKIYESLVSEKSNVMLRLLASSAKP